MAPKAKPVDERFWGKVNKDGPVPEHCPELGPCWVWTSTTRSTGWYGAIWNGSKTDKSGRYVQAHRFSWEMRFGPIPDGLWVLHKCDFGKCIRPDHLFLGTAAANTRDMIAKGRARFREERPLRKTCTHGHLFTSENTWVYSDKGGYSYRVCKTCKSLRVRGKRNTILDPEGALLCLR